MATAFRLREAARTLRAGGLVAYPTEAVYGLGCDPWNGEAVQRLLALKQRPWQKGLILIAADREQIQPFISPLEPAVEEKLEASWPSPISWLLPVHPAVPEWLRGEHEKIALRITAHPLAAALCRTFGGAIVSTSANLAGRPPARDPLSVQRAFGDAVDCILHGPLGGAVRPSEIRDAESGAVVRAG